VGREGVGLESASSSGETLTLSSEDSSFISVLLVWSSPCMKSEVED
jgi:hypothetical protein